LDQKAGQQSANTVMQRAEQHDSGRATAWFRKGPQQSKAFFAYDQSCNGFLTFSSERKAA